MSPSDSITKNFDQSEKNKNSLISNFPIYSEDESNDTMNDKIYRVNRLPNDLRLPSNNIYSPDSQLNDFSTDTFYTLRRIPKDRETKKWTPSR